MDKVILIVEDDPMNQKLFRDLLQSFGYVTMEAGDGAAGVEMARACHPALILMDIHMPKVDGLEATRMLKADADTVGIPIVALTACAMRGDEDVIRAAGCDGYLSKPLAIRELLETVRSYLAGANRPEEVPCP